MKIKKSGMLVIALLVVFALLVAGTAEFTGNLSNDIGNYTNPLTGLLFLVVFVVSVFLVMRDIIPGSSLR